MEVFRKSEAVKLRSHLDKYVFADADRSTVRQSRNQANSRRAIWLVEFSTKPNTIRLKNYSTGLYLTASDMPFLLGMTGKKVIQSSITLNSRQQNVFVSVPGKFEWFPIRDGFQIKFKTTDGNFLRANGGTPPWRNTITHDVPISGGGTYNSLLWDVDSVDLGEFVANTGVGDFGEDGSSELLSPMSSFAGSEFDDDFVESGAASTGPRQFCSWSPSLSMKKSAMELFHNAKAVRLRCHHDKYLTAKDDEESVSQDRNGSAKNARWSVEFVNTSDNVIRLKSCYGKYLTASNEPFLLGMTGHKVLQTLPRRLDSSIEWEPVRCGSQVKLKTRYGQYMRANRGLPPWRNSVTHDVPYRNSSQEWILWDVDIIEILEHSDQRHREQGVNRMAAAAAVVAPVEMRQEVAHSDSFSSETSSPSADSGRFIFSRQESNDSAKYSPPKSDGRMIYYSIAYDDHDVNDAVEGYSFTFKGSSVEELTHKLEEETKLNDVLVCTRSPLNGKLYPIRLQLPPNSTTMHVVVVPSSSILASKIAKMGVL